jgi:diketogulonate reductase-like aldo/keto reductase
MDNIILRNGKEMPRIFMSANCFDLKQTEKLIITGLESGVRGFDCAREYGSEKRLGKALKFALEEKGISRKDVFIQSRISNWEIREGNIINEIEKSLKNMGLDYFDCFMFHWPTPAFYIKSWKGMEDAYKNNLTKSIGVCNFRIRHFMKMDGCVEIFPHVLQAEFHPFRQAPNLINYCNNHKIAIQAFSPLLKMIPKVTENKTLKELALKYKVPIATLILRWHIQKDLCPISMTSKMERIKENFNICSLNISETDMAMINLLDEEYKFHLESATCPGF